MSMPFVSQTPVVQRLIGVESYVISGESGRHSGSLATQTCVYYTERTVPFRRMSWLGGWRRAALIAVSAAAVVTLAVARFASRRASAGTAPPAHFVGSAACAGCHPSEQAAWASSHHRHAMEPATASSVAGDFSDVRFRYFGRETRFTRRRDSFQVTTENRQGQPQTFTVAYTLGTAPLQQYLVALDDGRIQALPFAWDARPRARGGQRWFHLYPDANVTPADPLFWMRPRQNWNHMCGDCHTTDFSKRFSDATGRFDSRWSELGNGCESCHGAGSTHVEAAQHGARGAAAASLVNGLHMQGEQLDQCGACHARRVRLREDPSHERMHETWRPELLQEGLYFPDGQIRDEVFEIGSFLQSKMAARGVACSHCHEPHTARLRAEGNALCTRCHDRQIFDGPQHHFHAAGTDGARCVSCHMPQRTYMVVHERRDHRIAVPRPDLSARLGTPNACAACHTGRGDAWAAEAIARHRSGRRQGPWGAELLGPAMWSARHEQPDALASVRALVADPRVAGLPKATALAALGTAAPLDVAAIAGPLLHDPDPWARWSRCSPRPRRPARRCWRRRPPTRRAPCAGRSRRCWARPGRRRRARTSPRSWPTTRAGWPPTRIARRRWSSWPASAAPRAMRPGRAPPSSGRCAGTTAPSWRD